MSTSKPDQIVRGQQIPAPLELGVQSVHFGCGCAVDFLGDDQLGSLLVLDYAASLEELVLVGGQ